jgi:hypothetical protein
MIIYIYNIKPLCVLKLLLLLDIDMYSFARAIKINILIN